MNKDNEDLQYIKKFSQITITEACKLAEVNKSNLWSGRTSKKNIRKVRKIIESSVARLYIEDNLNE